MADKIDPLKRAIPVICDVCNGAGGWEDAGDQSRVLEWVPCPKCNEEGVMYVQE